MFIAGGRGSYCCMRALLVVLALLALGGFSATRSLAFAPTWNGIETAPRECCKICRKGKACGDSCIARDKDCHKPPGCACDG